MSNLRVDHPGLADFVAELARCSADLEAVEAEVRARVERLHVTWRGEAATRQAAAHRRWADGARHSRDALAILRVIAQKSGDNYAAAGHAGARMWSA